MRKEFFRQTFFTHCHICINIKNVKNDFRTVTNNESDNYPNKNS